MKKPTPIHRYAPWVLVVCLSAAVGCGQTPVDQLDLTTLLPGEPAGILAAEIPALRKSEIWGELQGIWLGQRGSLVDLELFLEDAGIDPEEDLGRLLVGLYPGGHPAGEFNAVLTGRFSRETLLPELQERGFSVESHRDQTLVLPPARGIAGPDAPVQLHWHLVYFDDTAIGLADTREGAAGMIDRRLDGGESLDLHPGLGPLLAEVDRTAPLWGAGLLPEDAVSGLEADLPVQGMIPTLEKLCFSATVTPELHLTCVTLLADEQEASRLASQLNGWAKLAAGLIQTNPQWFDKEADGDGETLKLVAETLDRMVISASGPSVRLEAGIPLELIREAARSTATDEPQPLHSP